MAVLFISRFSYKERPEIAESYVIYSQGAALLEALLPEERAYIEPVGKSFYEALIFQ